MKRENVFRSRISVLLIGIILAVFIPIFIPIFQGKFYLGIYVISGIFFFIISIITGMRYVITGDKLIVMTFWFIPASRVDITRIEKIERSYNPLSSAASSLKRLKISIIKGIPWLISPVREKEFLEALRAINPHIYVKVPHKKGFWHILDWDI